MVHWCRRCSQEVAIVRRRYIGGGFYEDMCVPCSATADTDLTVNLIRLKIL